MTISEPGNSNKNANTKLEVTQAKRQKKAQVKASSEHDAEGSKDADIYSKSDHSDK